MVTSALLAGTAAGLIAAVLQLLFVQPVLLHAELYESGALQHFGASSTAPATQATGGLDLMRDGLSILFSMLVYVGYALALVALMAVAEAGGADISGRTGILWGTAGFVAVHLAPAFSLPPELPGAAAADITARQIWWFATVAASALALWLIAYGRGLPAWGAACALLLAPHLVGAPAPEIFTGPVPTELSALFAARALGVSFAAWVLLGVFAGYFWSSDPAKG